MTEKKYLSCVLTEGILLALIGILMLMLPKLTTLSFGIIVCLAFIVYGGYKAINALLTKNYTRHFILNMVLGLVLMTVGVTLYLAPMFNLVLIISIIGAYFIIESVSTCAFGIQNRQLLYFWWANIPLSIMQFLLGLIIILGLPSTALWVIGILAGINFLVSGIIMINMYITTKYIREVA